MNWRVRENAIGRFRNFCKTPTIRSNTTTIFSIFRRVKGRGKHELLSVKTMNKNLAREHSAPPVPLRLTRAQNKWPKTLLH